MKFPNLRIIWTEGKNLSLPDLLSCSLTTTTRDKHRLRTVEIPDSIKFFLTHNQNNQPIQCYHAVSKEYINTLTKNTNEESPPFSISLQMEDNCFEVKLENYIYLPSSYHVIKTKAQPLEHLKQNKTQQLKNQRSLLEFDPIVQHTDVTLNTNKTEAFTQFPQNTNYKDLINTIKFSLPGLDDLMPKSPEIYIYF